VILATTSQDLLTGGASQDQFVFTPTPAGPSVQHTITDFLAGTDKIDLTQFSNISASALPTEAQQGNDTLITLDSNDSLLVKKHRCRKPARQRFHRPCLAALTQCRMLVVETNVPADASTARQPECALTPTRSDTSEIGRPSTRTKYQRGG